ncbi:helix-turn-helix transcriptional regulator [Kitasatospora sp. NPDC052896]|uniref:helix-turn-helix transcriptional regulator n=1 Tax=Kitasatospora sp. NPDC052896 TaxID=3364061 RepID=UPI0037CAE980
MGNVSSGWSSSRTRRAELRDFLRSRRAALKPEEVGLSSVGLRRTPGLRREEVAVLAGIGVSWYTWLEQGRDIKVSPSVLDAVSRALRLDEPERAHLHRLAGLHSPLPRGADAGRVSPRLQRIVDRWMPFPAKLVDRYGNIPVFNSAAGEVFGLADGNVNEVVRFFLDDEWRTRFPDAEAVASELIGFFRAQAARYPEDRGFTELARRLRAESPIFERLWQRHEISLAPRESRVVEHPRFGRMTFEHTSLELTEAPDLRLHLYAPDQETATATKLKFAMRQFEMRRFDRSDDRAA